MLGGPRLGQAHALFSKQALQSEDIHEVLSLHTPANDTCNKERYIVPCTVPYLFVIHDNNLIICLCVFHSETEIKTASFKSDRGEASHRYNGKFSCFLTALSLNSSHVYGNQDQQLDNWAASFELVREW
jgi:hypothetical protein